MDKAKEKLHYESLTEEDKKRYDHFQENRRIENSVRYTAKLEEKREIAKNLLQTSLSNAEIAKHTDLTIEN
ncbi:MAG: hypothetical protein NZ551_11980 [Microscillaceae bacterium]|nr:hypothetical protein [Microscillaceae bacterium]MDW8461914.1 hypothetical protein [Cytophagales bacterium]